MSRDSADFVANSGDTIEFSFTPQPNGFAFFASATLTEEKQNGKHTVLTVTANKTSFSLPQDDSFVQVAIVDGPVPENGTLTFTVNGGAGGTLWPNRPLSRMPGAFFGFGSAPGAPAKAGS
jgi:hypothetical protein